jgi:hypothetical protein
MLIVCKCFFFFVYLKKNEKAKKKVNLQNKTNNHESAD